MRARLAAATAAAVTLAAAVPAGAAGGGAVLERAARAAAQADFLGVVELEWRDATGPRSEVLLLQGSDGAVMARGSRTVVASADRELLVQDGDEWSLLWPSGLGASERPALTRKYSVVERSRGVVGGRPTRAVEILEGTQLRERLHLDLDTGMLLRREHFEWAEAPSRSAGFETITVGPEATTVQVPPPSGGSRQAARGLSPADLDGAQRTPASLDGAYQRVALYRHGAVVQALYGDGLYDLSVFQQRGSLDTGALPEPSEAVAVGEARGRHYRWAGGHAVIWEAGGTVFAAVSDAPLDQLLQAAASLPAIPSGSSLLSRIGRLCAALLLPLKGP